MGACCSTTRHKLSPEEEEAQRKSRVEDTRRGQQLRSNLVHQTALEDPEDKYEVVKELGVGSMGSVSLVRPRRTPRRQDGKDVLYALKTLRMGRVTPQYARELLNEIKIVSNLDHPGIVKFLQVYHGRTRISIVMEYCSGGDLYRREPYTERTAAAITGQVLSAVAYMHESQGYVHRDIKFENIMFETPTSSKVKIIDFGLSGRFNPHKPVLTATYGTLHTMAPEVLDKSIKYDNKCDLWSVGVVAFELISGVKPFESPSVFILQDKIAKAEYDFKAPGWHRKSKDAQDFCRKLLQIKPQARPSASQALRHKWIAHSDKHSNERHNSVSLTKFVESNSERQRLLTYAKTPEIQKIATLFVAHNNSFHDQAVELRQIFEDMDTEKTGYISLTEFQQAFSEYSGDKTEMQAIFDGMDAYGDGRISYSEFLAAALSVRGFVTEDRLAVAFEGLDVDRSGKISTENLRTILGRDAQEEVVDGEDSELKRIIDEVDTAGDGMISLEELMAAYRQNCHGMYTQCCK